MKISDTTSKGCQNGCKALRVRATGIYYRKDLARIPIMTQQCAL